MAGRVPDSVLRQIEQRVSLLDVVADYLTLKKQGRNYVGLCPFHNEKTPSFSVSPDKGLFYCFGCGAGGGLFQFLMRAENIDFLTAVERLAKRAGIRLEEVAPRGSHQRQLRGELLEEAAGFFARCLQSKWGGEAREYLESRQLNKQIVEHFRLGYCPGGSELHTFLSRRGFAEAEAIQAGLLGKRASGSTYPRFWRRVVFPIRDLGGRVIGFGARALTAQQEPKYLNSPESANFRKSETLYGLYEARQAARNCDRVLVVEGYFDALQLVQAGFSNTVATMGTALTSAHARLVRRFARECLVLFDGDEAGQRAAERAFGICAEAGLWALGAFLPAGADPDSFVRDQGAEAMRQLLGQPKPLLSFFLGRVCPEPTARVAERLEAAHKVRELVNRIEDPALASEIMREAAQRLGVGEEAFRVGSTSASARAARSERQTRQVADPLRTPPEERTLVEAMLLDPKVARWVAERALWNQFENRELASLAAQVAEEQDRGAAPEELLAALPPQLQAALAQHEMGVGPLSGVDLLAVARDCADRLAARARRARLRALRTELEAAERQGDRARIARLREELKEVEGPKPTW